MPLSAGVRLGPYEIQHAIGAGGMGEVYKARDTRLDRTVAVKIISATIAGTPELRERFEREARTISQLNHPHICTLHDIGDHEGVAYLVLEHLEGETLAERLLRGPLPLEQALPIAIQICDALDKAHRQGIIHRDLKPGNVMLTKAGAKLLDFGLAKATVVVGDPVTITTPLTRQGTILGTFQYMAPEQIEGAEADARSDIWAFGCVLYEMLTGRKPFEGKTHAGLISAILATQPAPLTTVQPLAQPALDHVVRTCLAKNPEDRSQTAHDVLLQLRWIAEGGSQTGAPSPAVARRRASARMLWPAALVASILATGAIVWFAAQPAPPAPPVVIRAAIDVPSTPVMTGGAGTVALSPHGTRLVYVAIMEGGTQLFVRSVNSYEPTAISGTEGAISPFFSPDGQWIAFFSSGKLKKVLVSGGAAATICDASTPFGGTWGPDGTIVFSGAVEGGLVRVPAEGGQPTPFTTLDKDESSHRWPAFLPNGRAVLYAAALGGNWGDARIVAQPLDGSPRRIVAQGGTAPAYVETGHVLFARSGLLLSTAFDAETLNAGGTPRQVLSDVSGNETSGSAHYAVSGDGTLAYVAGRQQAPKRTLVWVNRDGTTQTVPVPPRAYDHPRISPNGQHIAMTIRDGDPDVWVLDLARGALTRLTFEAGEDESAIWTPDGKRLTFSASRSGKPRQTLWRAADGSGVEEALFTSKSHQHLSSWTPDGKVLLFEEVDTTWGIFMASLGDKEAKPFVQQQFQEWAGQISPDGAWLAYTSNESGRNEVYVQAFPGPGGKYQISTNGGGEARWARNGREIFYRTGDRMMAVPVAGKPTFSAGTPRLLFEGSYSRLGWAQANYDVSPDGRRFLMIKGEEQPAPTAFKVIVNWFEELRNLAPGTPQ